MLGATTELRDGVSPSQLIEHLQRQSAEAKNALAGTSIERVRDAYLRWAHEAERLLQYSYADPLVPLKITSLRHWQIRELTESSPQAYPVIQAEVETQRRRIDQLADALRRRITAVGSKPGLIAVLDTNVLLHHRPVASLPWPAILSTKPVRLVLPLRVVEELDEKKWSESEKLRKRARKIIPDLTSRLDEPQLSPDVTIEMPVLEGLERTRDADQAILETCLEIQRFTANDLVLVTGDLGMTIRARALGLDVVAMPEEFRRVRDGDPVPPTTTSSN